jgi:D-alanyl-lipoteichoic acid acyltransferase DltB (MBOAT superfamily)
VVPALWHQVNAVEGFVHPILNETNIREFWQRANLSRK